MKLVKFATRKFAKFHFGEDGLDNSLLYFPSPSLFSAIVNNYVKLYGPNELEKLLSIRISSLYPGYRDSYFIPRPMSRLNLPLKLLEDNPKIAKKINFLSFEVLKDNNRENIEFNNDQLVNGFLFSKGEKENYNTIEELVFVDVEDKVTLSRISDSAEESPEGSFAPYSVYYFYINSDNFFFYFLLDDSFLDENMQAKLESSIRLIQDEGLGGERATGSGLFESVEFLPSDFYDSYIKDVEGLPGNKQFVSLSTVIPKNEDEFKEAISYQLVKRGGFIYQPGLLNHKKKDVYAIADGSIFKNRIEGKFVDVSPVTNTKVFQFGYFFGIPFIAPLSDYNDRKFFGGRR
jgi:CRISPR-associated protein Csm4